MTLVRIGTRGSALALAQTQTIANSLAARTGVEVEIVTVRTEGDTSTESLASLGGTGVFAGALREALIAGRCDVVVHSLKDLPTAAYPGLSIGAVPKRVDARDALCARDELTLDTLPEGAKVGTGSPRRAAQLRSRRPDLEVVDIRGNVDTRLAHVGRAVSTPSCWRPRDWTVSGASAQSPSISVSTAGHPPPGRARSRSRCAPARRSSSPHSTTARAA